MRSITEIEYMDLDPAELFFEDLGPEISSKKDDLLDSREPKPVLKLMITTDNVMPDTSQDVDESIENSSIDRDVTIPFKEESLNKLISMLDYEDFENGVANPSEKYFQKLFFQDRIATLNGLSKYFMDNYSTDDRKTNTLVGILHMLSHNRYKDVYPLGQMMAVSALSHKNFEVAEFGIKCFENWGHADGAVKLKAVNFPRGWLQEYANDVIEELTEGD